MGDDQGPPVSDDRSHGQPEPGSSWDVASRTLGRYAAADGAQVAAEAIVALMNAARRRRSVTVQWMPQDHGHGCRFEIIRVHDGGYMAIIDVAPDGRVTLRDI